MGLIDDLTIQSTGLAKKAAAGSQCSYGHFRHNCADEYSQIAKYASVASSTNIRMRICQMRTLCMGMYTEQLFEPKMSSQSY